MNKLYQKEYVLNYTNASVRCGKGLRFQGRPFQRLRSPRPARYDKKQVGLTRRARTVISLRDDTLEESPAASSTFSRSIIRRYTLKNASDVTGVSEENLLKVWKHVLQPRASLTRPARSCTLSDGRSTPTVCRSSAAQAPSSSSSSAISASPAAVLTPSAANLTFRGPLTTPSCYDQRSPATWACRRL